VERARTTICFRFLWIAPAVVKDHVDGTVGWVHSEPLKELFRPLCIGSLFTRTGADQVLAIIVREGDKHRDRRCDNRSTLHKGRLLFRVDGNLRKSVCAFERLEFAKLMGAV